MSKPQVLKLLAGEKTDYTPIWIMRQAGRYLPEYRELRQKFGSFQKLYKHSEAAATVTMQPLQRFDLDAAIVFSDILVALEAVNIAVDFASGGPRIAEPFRSEKDLNRLPPKPQQGSYDFLQQTLKLCKAEIADRTLIGFIGSPWTLAAYAVEGQGSKTFSQLRRLVYTNPKLLHQLLNRLTDEVIELALAQVKSGADVIQIFDSWAGLLGKETYAEFSYTYIEKIVASLRKLAPDLPVIVFGRSAPFSPAEMAACKPAALGFDWQTDISVAFAELDGKVAVQGNLDPAALYGDEKTLQQAIDRIMQAGQNSSRSRHIFNLGHGIYPDTDPDRVAYLVDAVHGYK